MSEIKKTSRTSLSRAKQRGSYDRETIYSILDSTPVCQVGFIRNGHPAVLPMAYGRLNNKIYLHGAEESPFLKDIAASETLCISVFILDGLVFARSAFHHSMNFRSAVMYGKAEKMVSDEEKIRGLKALTDRILPGRWENVRLPTSAELKQTMVLAFPVEEASAKIRSGGPLDSPSDMDFPVWAGTVPVKMQASSPVTDRESKIPAPENMNEIFTADRNL